MKTNTLVLLLALSAFFACTDSTSENQDTPKLFFDLEAYFSGEIDRLNREQPSGTKQLRLNDKEDAVSIDTLDFKKELTVFKNSDINKIAWADKYQADTLRENGQITQITYTALDEKLKTQQLSIHFSNGTVNAIDITNKTHNLLMDASQLLHYDIQQGYEIKQEQKMRFMRTNKMEVSVRYTGK